MKNYSDLLVTGGTGLIGFAIKQFAPDAIFVGSKDYDLRSQCDVKKMFEYYKPKRIIHLAGKVGGLKANMQNPAEFYYDNMMINTNILHFSHLYKVEKLVSCLSTCIFPDKIQYPLKENYLHNGPPHESNYAYAYAKRMVDIQTRSYREQYGSNFVSVVPTNVFGPNDNYNINNGHVIPSLIHKAYIANMKKENLEIWGTGTPLRDFIYSQDLARLIIDVLEEYSDSEPISLATGDERSIKEIANLIFSEFDEINELIFDPSKPDGQFRKPVDISKIKNMWPDFKFSNFETSLKDSVDWFKQNYESSRK